MKSTKELRKTWIGCEVIPLILGLLTHLDLLPLVILVQHVWLQISAETESR